MQGEDKAKLEGKGIKTSQGDSCLAEGEGGSGQGMKPGEIRGETVEARGGGIRYLARAGGAGGLEQSTETANESMAVVCRAGQSAKLALGAKYNSIGFFRRRLQFSYSLSLWVSEFWAAPRPVQKTPG